MKRSTLITLTLVGMAACLFGVVFNLIGRNYVAAVWAFSAFLWALSCLVRDLDGRR